MRVGIGSAVLTRAELFRALETINGNEIEIDLNAPSDTFPLSSFRASIKTEAKYLAMALHFGVLHGAFGLNLNQPLSLGIFGKMNLLSARISVIDDSNNVHPIELANVQFELDFSVEDKDCIYVIEAKLGKSKAKSFNTLQLFYPYILLQNLAAQDKKQIRTFFVNITETEPKSISFDFHEYSFRIPFVANSAVLEKNVAIHLLL